MSEPVVAGPRAPDAELAELVLRLGEPRGLVVGDGMLGGYVWGDAARLRQEAPAILLPAHPRRLPRCDIVLVSDYDKGVCTPGLPAAVVAAAKASGVKVVADPIRGGDYRKSHGCSTITPNRLEAGLAVGRTLNTVGEALA